MQSTEAVTKKGDRPENLKTMNQLTKMPTDTWVAASWDEYIQAVEDPTHQKAKSYYYNHQLRIEMSPVGSKHAWDHHVIIGAILLFTVTKGIKLNGRDNCSYRKAGYQEAQPDVSYYIGENANVIPWETSIVDLNIYPPPNLVIEVANTSLADDKGEKRLLYENLNVGEYWIVDVKKAEIIAFAIANGGSQQITQSQVLPGLAMSLLEETLQRTRSTDQNEALSWLLTQFQQ